MSAPILDVGVRAISSAAAVGLLDDRFDSREPTPVTFANAHTLNTATSDRRLRAALRRSIVFNDGVGVDIASRLLFGKPFPDNLNGTDFVPNYLLHTRNRYRIFLFGAPPGVAERAADRLARFAPHHRIVGSRDGYARPLDMPGIIADIRASHADVLLVGLGNPIQELWLMENLAETGCRLGFAVGALLDFMAGRFPRAPEWMRELRLEWVYRLVQEPLRLWRPLSGRQSGLSPAASSPNGSAARAYRRRRNDGRDVFGARVATWDGAAGYAARNRAGRAENGPSMEGRIFFAIIDQGFGSATNFLATILYAAWLPLDNFGNFADPLDWRPGANRIDDRRFRRSSVVSDVGIGSVSMRRGHGSRFSTAGPRV